jgi:hypothetical protein
MRGRVEAVVSSGVVPREVRREAAEVNDRTALLLISRT